LGDRLALPWGTGSYSGISFIAHARAFANAIVIGLNLFKAIFSVSMIASFLYQIIIKINRTHLTV
jgi:ribosome-interacting GTPase 1